MSKSAWILAFNFILLSSASALPQRWIVKNPLITGIALERSGLTEVNRLSFGRSQFIVIETSSGRSRESLLAVTGAEDVSPDFPVRIEPVLGSEVSDATPAWHVTRMKYGSLPAANDGKGVVVAIIDTGVDHKHPALKNRMWVNEKEISGNGIDDDNNGFIDDIHGWSFARKSADTSDQSSHGTHCAGIVAAEPQDATADSARGVAPGARIMAVHIISGAPESFLSDAALGIKYAVDNGAKVLSNSWRLYKSWTAYVPNEANTKLLREAIEYAQSRGAIFVAAAGNERINIDTTADPIFPVGLKGLSNLVGVAASTSVDDKASFTNFGAVGVHVAAPGDYIVSTIPNGGWTSMSGTSMATPLVSGALARGLSAQMSATEVVRKLKQTSDALTQWQGAVETNGIVNLMSFLQ